VQGPEFKPQYHPKINKSILCAVLTLNRVHSQDKRRKSKFAKEEISKT
jgi:hypothetical protein